MSNASRRIASSGLIVLAMGACRSTPPAPGARASLGGAIARVGDYAIPPSLVADVAEDERLPIHGALDRLVDDALAAHGAQVRGFDRDPAVSWPCVAALARRVPARLLTDAAALGPPSNDELALVTVVHAVVLRSPTLTADDALAIAAAIRRAVVGARSADAFDVRARAVSHPHAQVIVERIGPLTADGLGPDGVEFDAGFVATAFTLHAPQETAPVIATPFGWHVIQLVDRAAPDGALADRRRELAGAVVQLRARIRLDALLRARASAVPVEVSVGADELMSSATAPP
jgi:hypothetical protein